jgi:membrane protein CcdC involved in cytochrome C biogenesis
MTVDIARYLTLGAGVFSAVVLIITIWMMRRERRVSRLAPFIAIGTTLLSTFFYMLITNAPVNSILVWGFIGFGFLIGLLQGQSTKIYYRGKAIFGKRSTAYLVLWGLAYLVSLALAQLGNAALYAFAILGMMFGLGITVGASLNLFVRQTFLRPQTAPPAQPSSMVGRSAPRVSSKPTDLPR